jgi:hypothetical protein
VRLDYADRDVRFVAVSIDPDVPNIRATAARLGLGMTQWVAEGEVLGPLHVARIPSTVFIDRTGLMVAAANGKQTPAFFKRRVEALLER